jgi:pSer/pThr/pTyr-binding forkhead associated (FHA) protein
MPFIAVNIIKVLFVIALWAFLVYIARSMRGQVAGPPVAAAAPNRPAGETAPAALPAIHIELETGETKEFRLDRDVVIGRGEGCDIVVDDEFASDRHAAVSIEGTTVWLEDLDSTNGTTVAGTRISGRVRVEPGTPITVGRTKMVLR